MSEIFLQRDFDPPLTVSDVLEAARTSQGCFSLRRVDWLESLLASDGRRLICWFRGPDLESAREALRQSGAIDPAPWAGRVHDAPLADAPDASAANVAVERSFREPVELDAIQAIEDAGVRCLELRRVRFARTYFSHDRRRMVCLYQAPDAESVREAQREAGVPFDSVWAFTRVTAGS